MAVVLFVVRATITKEKEAAFNHWYNTDHAPKVLRFNGAVSARRYKKISGPDKYQYMVELRIRERSGVRRLPEVGPLEDAEIRIRRRVRYDIRARCLRLYASVAVSARANVSPISKTAGKHASKREQP